MPLEKSGSKAAMSHNIKAEMHAGKPKKQALAIAYSVKRKAGHKAHGGSAYAHGGQVTKVQDPKRIVAEIMGHMAASKPEGMEEHDADMAREAASNVEPSEHVMPEAENEPEHMLAEGGEVLGEAKKSSGDLDELHRVRMEGDQSNFLSDEEDMETPFHSTRSDEEELDEHDMGAHPSMDNEEGNASHEADLASIVAKMRRKHLGSR